MSDYIVSARKYRPDSFGTLVGQDNIARTLKNSILRGQLAHAYLFCGPRGVGKTSTARIFAKMINCSNPSAEMEPCGECESCKSFAEGRSYCIHELDAASNNGVEDIKALMDQVQIPPQVGRYSVYIIDEVHMLSTAAFNAFLKTLEEPPAHAIFILATTEKHKVLPTILSRCQTYDFNRISVSDMVANLKAIAAKEGVTADEESLHVIARKADGAMRDALTIFDQTVAFCGTDIKYRDVIRNLNVLDSEYGFSLVDNFLAGDYATPLKTFDEILAKGFNALHFVSCVGSHLRDLLVCKAGGIESLLDVPESVRQRYREQASRADVKFLYDALGVISQCEAGYKAAVNQRLHIEFCLMRLAFLRGVPASTSPSTSASSASPASSASSASSASVGVAADSADKAGLRRNASLAANSAIRSTEGAAELRTSSETPEGAVPSADVSTPGHGQGEGSVGCKLSLCDDAADDGRGRSEPSGERSSAGGIDTPGVAATPTEAPVAAPAVAAPVAAPAVAAEVKKPAAPSKKRSAAMAAISFDAILDETTTPQTTETGGKSAANEELPAEEAVCEVWKTIPGMYSGQPRMANLLATAPLELSERDGTRVATVKVVNEAQKKWIEENHLRKIEDALRTGVKSSLLLLEIEVLPEEQQEEKKYLPQEKAEDLMNRNPEVRALIADLALDVR